MQDRLGFQHFLDLTEGSSIPDAEKVRLFLNRMGQTGVGT